MQLPEVSSGSSKLADHMTHSGMKFYCVSLRIPVVAIEAGMDTS